MKKGELCVALGLSEAIWTEYWEGNTLIHNQNIGTFSKRNINPMMGYGLLDKLNLFADIPYIKTQASGGQMRGASGLFQFDSLF